MFWCTFWKALWNLNSETLFSPLLYSCSYSPNNPLLWPNSRDSIKEKVAVIQERVWKKLIRGKKKMSLVFIATTDSSGCARTTSTPFFDCLLPIFHFQCSTYYNWITFLYFPRLKCSWWLSNGVKHKYSQPPGNGHKNIWKTAFFKLGLWQLYYKFSWMVCFQGISWACLKRSLHSGQLELPVNITFYLKTWC